MIQVRSRERPQREEEEEEEEEGTAEVGEKMDENFQIW
jgi:hypothetical protein